MSSGIDSKADAGMREPLPAKLALPPLNSRVWMDVGTTVRPDSAMRAVDVPSRVEDLTAAGRNPAKEPARLLLAAPTYAGDAELPPDRAYCTVTWMSDRGPCQLPGAFVGVQRLGEGGSLRGWWLEVVGPSIRVQRRMFFRVPMSLPVTLAVDPLVADVPDAEDEDLDPDWSDPDGEAKSERIVAVQGRTLDVSEGGLRCTVNQELPEGVHRLVVRLALRDQVLSLPARVVRTQIVERQGRSDRPGSSGTHRAIEVALRFENPEEFGDLVRRTLFEHQLRERRRVGG